MLQAIAAIADVAIGRQAALALLLRSFNRASVWVLAALGLGPILGVQLKWTGIVHPVHASTMEIKGPAILFSRKTFVTDAARTYRPDADVGVLPNNDGAHKPLRLDLGAQTFNANGRELRPASATCRYAGTGGKPINPQQGWGHLGGSITDQGDTSHAELRPNTRSVEVVPLPGYQSADDKTTVMRNVGFSRVHSTKTATEDQNVLFTT